MSAGSLGLGCADDGDERTNGESSSDGVAAVPGQVSGAVKEWSVTVDTESTPAGEVTFTIANDGTVQHEFLVVQTDLPVGEIPVTEGRFSEDDVVVVDEIPEYDAGTTGTLTVTLEPGQYQLVCNIAGHYENGMHTGFSVT